MSTLLSPPPQLVERTDSRSGPIVNPLAPGKKYGVIYTTTAKGIPALSAKSLDPLLLLGAVINNLDQTSEDPYFTILGGYFCERKTIDGKPAVDISHLFGVVLDVQARFGLQPGNHMIGDTWEMEDLTGASRKFYLDERTRGEDGWTFVVTYKPQRRQYPFSGRPISIERACPVVGLLTLLPGASSLLTQEISASVQMSEASPTQYRWNWGDGSAEEITRHPQATHTYARAEGVQQSYPVTVTAVGPGTCQTTASAQAVISGFCPTLSVQRIQVTTPDHAHALVSLNLTILDGTVTEFVWDWGDGSPTETTSQPTATHSYPRSFGPDQVFQVTVTGKGIGTCRPSTHTSVQIPTAPCPVLESLSLETTATPGGPVTVSAAALVTNGGHTHYTWNWGDGSPEETTSSPFATHAYARQPGTGRVYAITVAGQGPSTCQSSISSNAFIEGACPEIGSLTFTQVALDDNGFETEARVAVTGPAPDSFAWNWGDGSPAETTQTPVARHRYTRPGGDEQAFTVTVQATGPADCGLTKTAEGTVRVPGICPVLLGLALTPDLREGTAHTVAALVDFGGPAPDQFEWNWGDGSPSETTSTPHARHTFSVAPGESSDVSVTVVATGPGSCRSVYKQEISLFTPCETDLAITYRLGAVQGLSQEVEFEATVEGPAPASFEWSFGDGSGPVTGGAVVRHVFPVGLGEDRVFKTGVRGFGLGKCAPTAVTQVLIPGVCPLPETLTVEVTDAAALTVRARVTASPGKPGTFTWNWGDGSPVETTAEPEAVHTYPVHFGADRAYQVQAGVSGPGFCPVRYTTASVLIGGRCPSGFGLETELLELIDQGALYRLKVTAAEGLEAVTSFQWNYGDGSALAVSSIPEITHTFLRLNGLAASWPVSVTAIGPDTCRGAASALVAVPAGDLCPVIQRIDQVISAQDPAQVTFAFVPVTVHGQPTEFVWNWGDGSADTITDEPTIYHTYPKTASAAEYTISLKVSGPGTCVAGGGIKVQVPPASVSCPDLKGIEVVSSKLEASRLRLEVKAVVSGGKPDQFTWTWPGQTGPLIGAADQVAIDLPRADTDGQVTLTVASKGPGACAGSASLGVDVPKKEKKSVLCRLLPYLLSFLGALTTGGLVVALAALAFDNSIPGKLALAIAPLAVGLVLFAVGWWLSRQQICPPGRCEWLAIGWASAIGGLVVSFALMECVYWPPFAIGFFIATGVLAFFWFRDCAVNRRALVMFIHLLLAFAAGLINFALVAEVALGCN